MNVVEFIEHLHPFDYLTPQELDQITAELIQKEYPGDSLILEQGGEISQYVYVIRHGSVKLQRDGRALQILEEGELFGFPSLLSHSPPSSNVIADEPTSLLLIPEAVFQTLLQNEDFAEHFNKNLSSRLQKLANIDSRPAEDSLTSPVRALMVHSLVSVTPDTTVLATTQRMRESRVSCVIVESEPPGIVTDRDLRNRVLAQGLSTDIEISQVMTQPVKSVAADTPLYSTLLLLFEEGFHHLPVTEHGDIVGLITTTDLLRHQAQSPFYLLKRLETLDGSAESLASYNPQLLQTVQGLFDSGLNPIQIGRVVSSINDTLLKRLLVLAEEIFGPPPTPYTWLIFFFFLRSEQILLTDQDNALVYLEDTPEAKSYFSRLAEYVTNGLLQAGFPPCPGGYMATNWCYPLDHWKALFEEWTRSPQPQAILEAAIFFDFRAVHGTLSLDSIEKLVLESGEYDLFLAHMARTAVRFRPPLGFFGRIRQKDGFVDLKKGGIAPIVGLGRVYALECGSQSRATVDRLEDAVNAGSLSQQGAENLAETFRFLQWLRLRHQLEEAHSHRTLDNKIRLENLSHLEKRYLKDAFLVIHEMQESAELRFRLAMLG